MANPFDSDNDDYLKRQSLEPVRSYTTNSNKSAEDQLAKYEAEIENYMQMSLDSTQRSCQQLESSHKLGEGAARELLEQREKLEKVEENLDGIHATTKHTQRSLNSLTSFFGGMFRNRFSRAPKENSKDEQNSPFSSSKSADQLSKIVNGSSDISGSKNSVNGRSSTSTPATEQHSLSASSRAQIRGTRMEAMDNQIDENLGHMSSKLYQLRALGAAIGEEVDDQNQKLDRIHAKTERNNAIVRTQEGQMRKLLG